MLLACTQQKSPPTILIDGVIYDGFELANGDEGIILFNNESELVDVGEWQLTDRVNTAVLPPNTLIEPQETLWLTKNGSSFSRRYRHVVDFELTETNPLINKLSGTWPALGDSGDQILLLDNSGSVVDFFVYKDGNIIEDQWQGTAVFTHICQRRGHVFRAQKPHRYKFCS